MHFWRGVVRVVGGWAGKKQLTKLRYLLVTLGWPRAGYSCTVEKATMSSSGSGPRAGYSCTDPVKWYVYSYQHYHDEWIFIRLTYS